MAENKGIEGLFMNLPSPIIIDILSRLPTKTIIQCRCVSKTWLKLFSETEFVSLHLSRSPTCFLMNNLDSSPPNSSFNLVEVEDEPDRHDLQYVPGSDLDLLKGGERHGLTMIGSINGLVCLNEFASQYDTVYLWNPTMRESITVQTPPEGERVYPNIVTYGFGLSSVTYHYKVARIFQELEIADSETNRRRICNSTCQVYTLGAGSWRSIGNAPFLYNCREHAIFLNGNLHWLIDDPDGTEFISCLDLEMELFHPFPPPPQLSKDNLATLNLYGGCLSICDNTSDFDIVIWVMKEYGIKKSWSKEIVISKYPIDLVGQYYEVVHIIKAFEDGEILLLWRDDLLLSYNPERRSLESFDARDLSGATKKRTGHRFESLNPCIEVMDHVSSFLSLKSFGLEVVNAA